MGINNDILFVVDVSRGMYGEVTVDLTRVDLSNGELLKSIKMRNDNGEDVQASMKMAHKIIEKVFEEKPSQIVFDKKGFGDVFYDYIRKLINKQGTLKMVDTGHIMYNDTPY